MINRHTVASAPQSGENTVSCAEVVTTVNSCDVVMLGMLLHRRMGIYQRDVLRGTGILLSIVQQCCTLDWNLRKRKLLYMSISDMLGDDSYRYYLLRRPALHNALDAMHVQGLLNKRTRMARRGSALVVMWGFTSAGRRMVDKYYCYLAGDYDHLLG